MSSKPVLCAFDASEPSILAAHTAAWLAEALDAPLELASVVDPDDLPALPPHGAGMDPHVRDALPEIQEQVAEDAARAELEAALGALAHTAVSGTVLSGPAPAVLRRYALERAAVLLVTGTSARRGLQRLLLGSVSGTLAAEAPCPVVVVPPGAALREPGPVLVGDDGSEHGRRAVQHAEVLAARLGREVVRVHVEDEQPVDALARVAHEQQACLVVAGTRGRGALRSRIFGSVATGLTAVASRPVMLVSDHAVPQVPAQEGSGSWVGAQGRVQWSDSHAAAWIGLLETHKRLTRELEAELDATHGLTLSSLELLSRLATADDQQLRLTTLAEVAGLSLSRVSRVVDALEQRGLVERRADADDARAKRAAITPAGLEQLHAALRTHFAGVERAFFEHLAEEDVETLARVFRRFRRS
jgi:nucleotide-binding universal stress UspA family protein/DNA-binding MarR family transcriptional regulator